MQLFSLGVRLEHPCFRGQHRKFSAFGSAQEGHVSCSGCSFSAELMDSSLKDDGLKELLVMAELRHRQSGCELWGSFEAAAQGLVYRCACGWHELVF